MDSHKQELQEEDGGADKEVDSVICGETRTETLHLLARTVYGSDLACHRTTLRALRLWLHRLGDLVTGWVLVAMQRSKRHSHGHFPAKEQVAIRAKVQELEDDLIQRHLRPRVVEQHKTD